MGVGAAARIYFSKPVAKLSLTQAALLAGLPQAPSEYNPILNPGAAKARRNQVLRQMAKQDYLTPERARAAQAAGLGLDVSDSYFEHREPYFFDYVENELIEELGARRAPGRARGAHDDRPRAAAGRTGSDAPRPALLDGPRLGAGLDRPAQRPRAGDGLQRQL